MIRVALFGLGAMGRNWLRVLEANRRFGVVAVVDPVAADATHRTAASIEFDAAVVATPTQSHFAIAAGLLSTGKSVLVEKPIASTVRDSKRLVDLAKRHGAHLAVGHVERFNPAVRAMGQVVQSGLIGTPIHISATRVGGYPKSVTGGNDVLLDLAVHDLDILDSLIGPLCVESSVCHSTVRDGVVDTAEILLSSPGGASASVHTNWITPCKIREMRVTGTSGVAFVDLIQQTVELVVGGARDALKVRKTEPLAAEADALADLIDGRDAGPLCTGTDAVRAVALAERALAVDVSQRVAA